MRKIIASAPLSAAFSALGKFPKTRLPNLPARASLVTRTQLLVALSVTVGVALSLVGLLFATRTWMIWHIDEALHSDLSRMVETYDSRLTLVDQYTAQAELTAPKPGLSAHPEPEHHKRDGHKKIKESEGLLLAVKADSTTGSHTEAIIVQRFQALSVPVKDLNALRAPRADTPQTMRLPESGRYRVLSHTLNGTTYIVGRGTGDINEMLTWTGVSALAILLFTAGLVALFSGKLVRRELQSLENIVQVSREVSQNLADAQRPGETRVSTDTAQRGSEIADVAYALNALLDSVDESLDAKEQSLEQLRQFVADASHELRTPLASIRGYTQLLSQGAADSTTALERIGAESARMSDLVEDLLLLARLDAGRQLHIEPVDVLPIAIESLADANAAAPNHHWSINFPQDAIDKCIIAADEAALRQICANLLSNARHHTPPGTTVSLDIVQNETHLKLSVSDNGPGIPTNLQANVFDRFVRGEESRSRENGGSTGLGLAIVSALTNQMGGTVSVESQPGEGTTFTLSFPRAHESFMNQN